MKKYNENQLKEIEILRVNSMPRFRDKAYDDKDWIVCNILLGDSYSYYGSESDQCMLESNAVTMRNELESINPDHVDGNELRVFEDGNATEVGLKWLELLEKLDRYPVLDEDDFYQRERECEESTLVNYKHDFIDSILKYFEVDEDSLDDESTKQVESLAAAVYFEDCSYSGLDGAFVNQESIERFIESSESEGHAEIINKLQSMGVKS